MKNKKEECGQLYKRWKELEAKLPKVQISSIRGKYESSDSLSDEEMKELNNITEELGKKYLDYLSLDGRFDIEQRMGRLGKKLK